MAVALREESSLAGADGVRLLLREISTTDGDLILNEEQERLMVQLHHLSNPMSDQVARSLADTVNGSGTLPGDRPALGLRIGGRPDPADLVS